MLHIIFHPSPFRQNLCLLQRVKNLAVQKRTLQLSVEALTVAEGSEAGIIAEQLLNNRLQMRASGATRKAVTLTKQTKIGLCEQVRVN